MNAEQIRAVLNELSDPQERLFVLLISVTGLRLGEILALRWCDFESDACALSISHTLYRGKLKKPKTAASEATLKLHPSIAGLLQTHKSQSTYQKAMDFVFCSVDGDPLNEAILRKHLYQAMDRTKIERTDRQFGFHIFRHSAGTLLYEKSRDLKLVQGTLRHADISTTSDIYVHLSDKVLNEGTIVLAEEILQDCDRIVTESSEMVS